MSIKNAIDPIGNRTRDIPACNAVTEEPYQTKILHLSKFWFYRHILFYQAQENGKKSKIFLFTARRRVVGVQV